LGQRTATLHQLNPAQQHWEKYIKQNNNRITQKKKKLNDKINFTGGVKFGIKHKPGYSHNGLKLRKLDYGNLMFIKF